MASSGKTPKSCGDADLAGKARPPGQDAAEQGMAGSDPGCKRDRALQKPVPQPIASIRNKLGDIQERRAPIRSAREEELQRMAMLVRAHRFGTSRVQPRYMQKRVIALLLFPNDDFIEFS
ncbi:hypothetical protein [Brevibacillus parabrevis]|uniref:hypothetical protein n=1 Tax=Brevibacillus parabrevis TaxID=54914 RepID=UPI0012F4C88D|nr:hypothetical protein [Brevibacillus parabrevis]